MRCDQRHLTTQLLCYLHHGRRTLKPKRTLSALSCFCHSNKTVANTAGEALWSTRLEHEFLECSLREITTVLLLHRGTLVDQQMLPKRGHGTCRVTCHLILKPPCPHCREANHCQLHLAGSEIKAQGCGDLPREILADSQ